ncbi:MAG: sterol desaturase family protein, partial [Nostocaceae cyanobacterium CSU_2_110]|nr:sterol desaturase family protein [Nostocaceae cyanobacterium CSU_2_110]
MLLANSPLAGAFDAALRSYLTITLVYYLWHRARHEVDFLWRWFHQVHHSPQRIELILRHRCHLPANLARGGHVAQHQFRAVAIVACAIAVGV